MSTRFANYSLLTTSNPKLIKSGKANGTYCSACVMMAPGMRSGKNLCPSASPGCLRACLNTSGHGREDWSSSVRVHQARMNRAVLFNTDKKKFFRSLTAQIAHFADFCYHHQFIGMAGGKPLFETSGSMIPCIRLNATSDIVYEKIMIPEIRQTIFELFPEIIFYDYTKIPRRFNRPRNYHLTYSRHELPKSEMTGIEYMESGVNMAVVFDTPKNHNLPKRYQSHNFDHPVIDGSLSDLRFLDPKGVIVGLYALEKAKEDRTGFVVNAALRNPVTKHTIDHEQIETEGLFPDLGGE